MKLGSTDVTFHHIDRKVTTCTVVTRNKAFTGNAVCSNGDNFCRNTGRKVALTKAIHKASSVLTKIQRRNVWNAYRDMTAKPRW